MRGLAVVALGAILIWFGLSRGDTTDASEREALDRPLSGAASSSDSDSSEDVTFAPAAQAPEDFAAVDRTVELDESPGGGGGSDRAPNSVAEVDDGSDDVGATGVIESPDLQSVAAEPAVSSVRDETGDTAEAARPAPDPFTFAGSSAPRPEKLATLLFEAWIESDPSDLETYLRVGEGADLPAAKGQLVAGFWEALVGRVDDARERLDAVRDDDSVTSDQVALLGAALDAPGERAVPREASARAGRIEPLAYAMRMVLLHDEAKALVQGRAYADAAQRYSDLIQMELVAPWEPHRATLVVWGKSLRRIQDNHRFAADGSWPYVEERVQAGDRGLSDVRKRVLGRQSDLLLCVGLLREVNGLGKYIHKGDVLRIPTDRANVIVDLDARVLLYRHGDEVVRLWDIGIGKDGHETPTGEFTVGEKVEKPAHTSLLLPYGHPDNPLGTRWMTLLKSGDKTTYGIHGTWDPEGVGGRVSLGCVRMRNEDVEELFEILPMGADVSIRARR